MDDHVTGTARTLILGFSGTSSGMTQLQREMVKQLLIRLSPREVHHGNCVGADAQFHILARYTGVPRIVVHPPTDPKARAFVPDADETLPEAEYLTRNRAIAQSAVDGLIATPKELAEVLRSGTWATVRYAREYQRTVYVVYPTGRCVYEKSW